MGGKRQRLLAATPPSSRSCHNLPVGTNHLQHRLSPSASPEEAAAIVAALERFMRATAVPARSPATGPDAWQRAARLEGVQRWPFTEEHEAWTDPWINT